MQQKHRRGKPAHGRGTTAFAHYTKNTQLPLQPHIKQQIQTADEAAFCRLYSLQGLSNANNGLKDAQQHHSYRAHAAPTNTIRGGPFD